MTAFQSLTKTDLQQGAVHSGEDPRAELSDSTAPTPPSESRTLLLDLSGDRRAATDWAERELGGSNLHHLNKADLKWGSKREALRNLRQLGPDTFALFTADLTTQSALRAMMLFGALTGARRLVMGDGAGRILTRSRIAALMSEGSLLCLELAIAGAVIVPLSWLLTSALGLLLRFRGPARRMNRQERTGTLLYIKATLSMSAGGAAVGGMATHVAGFLRGALTLGRPLKLVTGSAIDLGEDRVERVLIRPSAAISPTRASYELWNNLVFTGKAIEHVRSAPQAGGIEFIYQRYSRFNWTGVALSILTGRPLALEFNGSEVWVARHWDPVGQLSLLDRFERLNLRAADLIFVVSEAQRRNLLARGIDRDRILVNPNGVDPDEFHPGCGGRELRRQLGVTDKLVVGFTGTFGPWHGAPVLAEAACRSPRASRWHLLFVGDGEERAATEAIIAQATNGVTATFAGRIAHERVPLYLDACDILVAPLVPPADGSEFFGSPTKLFEYMAMARPVVASRLGQVAEVIVNGEDGILVEPGDAEALSRAIGSLAGDPQLRARLGATARQTVIERYTWRHNAVRVVEAMESFESGESGESGEFDKTR